MAKSCVFTIGVPGFEIYINYNPGNLRIASVDWTVPANVSAHVIVWDSGVEVVHTGAIGPVSDSANVPGNYRMVETVEGLALPSNISFEFQAEGRS